jgi:hypothetical protein
MSVRICSHCHRPHWNFPRAPGAPYCGQPCKDAARRTSVNREPTVSEMKEDFSRHLKLTHQGNDFQNCRECDRLRERMLQVQRSEITP